MVKSYRLIKTKTQRRDYEMRKRNRTLKKYQFEYDQLTKLHSDLYSKLKTINKKKACIQLDLKKLEKEEALITEICRLNKKNEKPQNDHDLQRLGEIVKEERQLCLDDLELRRQHKLLLNDVRKYKYVKNYKDFLWSKINKLAN